MTNVIDSVRARTNPVGRPSPPSPEGPDGQRSRVRWTRLIIGLLVVAASAVGVWLLVQAQSSPIEVWVARDRVDAGSVLGPEQVVAQKVEADSQLFAIATDVPVDGRVVRVTIPQGSTLVEGHFFSSVDQLGTAGGSLSQASIVFAHGRVPSVVKANDLLRLQVIGDEVEELFEQVPVVLVERGDRGAIVVTVEVGVDEGGRLHDRRGTGCSLRR